MLKPGFGRVFLRLVLLVVGTCEGCGSLAGANQACSRCRRYASLEDTDASEGTIPQR
jgi:hypothetical protein